MAKQPSTARANARAAARTTDADPTRPATFPLEDWIAGTVKPTRIIPVTRDPGTAAAITRHTERIANIKLAMSQVEGTTQSKRRLSQKDDRLEQIRTLEAEIERLTPTLDGTWLDVKVRGLEPGEIDAIRLLKPTPGYQTALLMFELAATVRPHDAPEDTPWMTLDRDGWDKFCQAIGTPQYNALDQACGDLSFGQVVDADFFTRPSASPSTEDSSGS